MSSKWQMPRPNMGDVVLFSTDHVTFSNPCIGWVIKEPGDSTLQILTFTPTNGWVERVSVHHRDDPAWKEDNGWQGLGVWDFTDSAKAAMKAAARAPEARFSGREQTTAK
jgi:G:T-mismatch repair DNA endonuclease (very short patch repair protein)